MSFNNKHWILGLICLSLNFSAVAQGDAEIGKLKTMGCMGCHGPTGNSFLPNFPALAGQPAGYIVKQIQDFKAANRYNATMSGFALGINDADLEHIGAFYASQIKTPIMKNIAHLKTEAEKTALLTLGKKLYDYGNADTGQAACFVCHGKNGDALVDLDVPILANQHPQYLISTLKEFKNRKRTNDNERVMRRIVDTMSAEEIEAVAYYSSYLVPTLEEKK
ncbi:MAG TPA: cytochrome c4 [Gammaproteobacteria bacterium]|jgi:cytochrome c553|nr:cytochrome c4 [Gammaproteobacteria bacterium]HAE70062.1 cytochrome c4 [Gammaproteobacteria bacterium]HAE73023.1 cytochrome c4 [Gammaproteobacteria bacterium]HAG48251.1 cytochrome c4 [Gammaproteobacteria bacterium]HAN33807.1 cytochrome c4 [Gammaproteobacteria bacterium]